MTATAGTARYGTVFGTTLYQADDPSTYNPQKITVQVSNGGVPVAGCEVAFAADHGNGWVFPDAKTTDASGRLSAYWTAGTLPNQAATATIAIEGGGSSSANINGNAQPIAETRGNSIHFTAYASSSYTEYEVQVTPVTAPPTTYYETQGWSGAYGGIQFDGASTQVLFSVWSTDSQSAQLRDGGACNVTVKFSGEGTGTSCRLRFPPSANGAVPGLPSDYMLRAGDTYQTHLLVSYPDDCNDQCTDYTFTFTDLTRHLGPISLGTQRYMAKVEPSYNDSFVEDWGSSPGDDCISAGARTAYFHDMRARVAGTWKPIVSGSFSPNFVPTNSEICANYYAGVESGKFLLSSGGDTLVGPPLFGKRRQLTLQ